VRGLMRKCLEDNVACVRDAAISALPLIWNLFDDQEAVLDSLQADLRSLAASPSGRRRMTFVACQQELILSIDHAALKDDKFWRALTELAGDPILGVRIGLARLVGIVFDKFLQDGRPIPGAIIDLAKRLSRDEAEDVRAYLPGPTTHRRSPSHVQHTPTAKNEALFSRPPLPTSIGSTTALIEKSPAIPRESAETFRME